MKILKKDIAFSHRNGYTYAVYENMHRIAQKGKNDKEMRDILHKRLEELMDIRNERGKNFTRGK